MIRTYLRHPFSLLLRLLCGLAALLGRAPKKRKSERM